MRDYIKVKDTDYPQVLGKDRLWIERHNAAVDDPVVVEWAIISLLDGLERYRMVYQARYDSAVEDDGFFADNAIVPIVTGIRALLNGELGRLDAGTIDGYLVKILVKAGELV